MNKLDLEVKIERVRRRIPAEWGRYISCDKGWYGIIIELDKDLSYLIPDYELHQVKEKFGELRYYIGSIKGDSVDERSSIAEKLIENARYLSTITCEVCGLRGREVKLRDAGWYKTLCDSCETARKNG